MAEYFAPESDDFASGEALVGMLKLLDQLFLEIFEDRWLLLPDRFSGVFARDESALPAAFDEARGQIKELIDAILAFVEVGAYRARLLDYGLTGAPLRFKLQVIEYANFQIPPARNRALERVSDRRRWRPWGYRKVVKGTLAAIDGPLESLTKMLGIGESVVEFKKGLEVLLDL